MKTSQSDIKVLIPDGEHFYLQKVLNCFAASGGVQLYIISNKAHTSMRYSRYIFKYFYFPRPADDQEYIGKINELCARYGIDVIMPLFEERIRTLVQHRDLLAQKNSLLVPDSVDLFDTANHKGLLAAHLERHNLPGPRSMEIKGVDQLYKSVGDLRFPILAKPPVNTGGGDGILKFGSAPSLQEYLQVHELTYPLVFQEFIEGFDTGCNVLCKDGEILAYTVQKGYLYKNKPFSPQIGLSIIHDQRVFLLAKNLMRSLNWNGVANIDLIYDVTNQEYKVLEINPRYWLTTVGSMMAGVNFPKLYCDAVMGVTFEIPTYKATRFADLKGLFVSVKRDKKLLFDKEFLWEQTPLKFALKDPVPMLYHWVWRTRNILKSRFGKRPSSPV